MGSVTFIVYMPSGFWKISSGYSILFYNSIDYMTRWAWKFWLSFGCRNCSRYKYKFEWTVLTNQLEFLFSVHNIIINENGNFHYLLETKKQSKHQIAMSESAPKKAEKSGRKLKVFVCWDSHELCIEKFKNAKQLWGVGITCIITWHTESGIHSIHFKEKWVFFHQADRLTLTHLLLLTYELQL